MSVLRDLLTPPVVPVTDPVADPVGYQRTRLHATLAEQGCEFIPFLFKALKWFIVLLFVAWFISLVATAVIIVAPHRFPEPVVTAFLAVDAAVPGSVGLFVAGRALRRRITGRFPESPSSNASYQKDGHA